MVNPILHSLLQVLWHPCWNVHLPECPQCWMVHVPKCSQWWNTCAEVTLAEISGAKMVESLNSIWSEVMVMAPQHWGEMWHYRFPYLSLVALSLSGEKSPQLQWWYDIYCSYWSILHHSITYNPLYRSWWWPQLCGMCSGLKLANNHRRYLLREFEEVSLY